VDIGDAGQRFVRLVRGQESTLRLDEAALLVAAHAHPGLDVDAQLGRLDDLAAGCRTPTLDGLVAHLFGREGFIGARDDYYNPGNSLLNEVLDRRRGIPITLSILAMEVGRRLGVPLSGVGMPGHFLLRDKVDTSVFVDPFSGGRYLDARQCERLFHAVAGREATFEESFLDPVRPRAIVARLLANLKAVYRNRGERRGLVWVVALRSAIPGVPPSERRELAVLLAASGRFDAAADELEKLAADVAAGPSEAVTQSTEHRQAARRFRARLN
jgi:regulator of sirC expression with transglutaminase-like and TPR domain